MKIMDNVCGLSYEIDDGDCPVDSSWLADLDVWLDGERVSHADFLDVARYQWKTLQHEYLREATNELRAWTERGVSGARDVELLQYMFDVDEE